MDMSALKRLKERQAQGGGLPSIPTHLPAAASHRSTDMYIAAFEGAAAAAQHQQQAQHTSLPHCTGTSLPCYQPVQQRDHAGLAAPLPLPGHRAPISHTGTDAPQLAAAWPLSQRNLLCASVDWRRQEAVLGSADHAAYTLDLQRQAKGRTLYSKTAGHREWVTAVAHLPDGWVATGGQDAAVWLWGPQGSSRAPAVAASQLQGHAGPVSQLEGVTPAATGSAATGSAPAAALVSASYDKRLIVWACATGGGAHQLQQLSGHRAPVLQLRLAGGLSASGDRDGAVLCWDLVAGAALGKPLAAHTGHCTALEWWQPACGGCGEHSSSSSSSSSSGGNGSSGMLLTGGQDGCVRVWDCRAGARAAEAMVAQAAPHAGPAGRGAVGSIAAGLLGGAAHLVVTAGADCTLRGLDSRRSLQACWTVQLPDFPYCVASAGSLLLAGCGDGSVVAVDAASGEQMWVLAASGSAIRILHAGAGLLVAGCDDGRALLYAFAGRGGVHGAA